MKQLLSDTAIRETIDGLCRSGRPDPIVVDGEIIELGDYELLVLQWFLRRKAIDHGADPSLNTIANDCWMSYSSAQRAVDRLVKVGWLHRSSFTKKDRTKSLSVNVDKLPFKAPERIQVSQQAKQLAASYMQMLQNAYAQQNNGMRKKKFPKGWLNNQFYSAQRILNDLQSFENPYSWASFMIQFALSQDKYKGNARKSLYNLLRQWRQLKADGIAHVQAQRQKEQQQPPVQQTTTTTAEVTQ